MPYLCAMLIKRPGVFPATKRAIRGHKRQLGVPGRRLLRTGCYRCGNGGRYPGNWYFPGSFRPFGRPVGMYIDWRR